MCSACLKKHRRSTSSWLRPCEIGPEFNHVAWLHLPALLSPVLVWSQTNYHALLKIVRYFEPSQPYCSTSIPRRKAGMKLIESMDCLNYRIVSITTKNRNLSITERVQKMWQHFKFFSSKIYPVSSKRCLLW